MRGVRLRGLKNKMSYLDEHYNEIFKKYNDEQLFKDIASYRDGRGRLSKVLNQWFEECIFECKAPRGQKSPMEALQNDDDIEFILSYIADHPNFYTGNEVTNVKSFFRNAGRLAQKVANFCPKNARSIYFRYHNIDGDRINCLDTSAGFGSRMSSVLLSGHNYCGFDPNPKLFAQLIDYKNWLREHNVIDKSQRVGLYKHGSEVHRPELDNMFDVSFTSPPYFNLEKYADDDSESTKNYNNYDLWLEKFVKPTIDNTYKYLKVGGYAMINIKNLTRDGKQPLFDDWGKMFKNHGGFKFVEIFEMKHQSAKNYHMNTNYDKSAYKGFKEPIMSWRKV